MTSAALLIAMLGAFDSDGWTHRAPLELPSGDAPFLRVQLTERVLDEAQPVLGDIRLVDGDGNLIRHVLRRYERPGGEIVWEDVSTLNRTYEVGAYARVTLDFGRVVVKDRIRVHLPGDNYRRYAVVEGSHDTVAWETVSTAWLFHIPRPEKSFRVNTIEFPRNDFPYLRITVYNMPDETGRIQIDRVEYADHAEPAPPAEIEVDTIVEPVEPEETEGQTQQQIFEVDLRWRHLPVRRITIAPADDLFHRGVELWGRNAETRERDRPGWNGEREDVPWTLVCSDVIYRMNRDGDVTERLTLDGLHAPYRYLQLRIFNADNPPLDMGVHDIAVHRDPLPQLVFERPQTGPVHLYFGNLDVRRPDYDLDQALGETGVNTLPEAQLAAPESLSPPEQPPLTERYTIVLWTVLALAVAIVLVLIARNFQKMEAGKEE